MTETGGWQGAQDILVVHASKMGSTAEIAEVIGEVLAGAGHRVRVLPARAAGELGPYGVVVLGSAVYLSRWRRPAVRFLRRHADELAGRDVWLFQSGPCGPQDSVRQLPAPGNVRRLAARIGARAPVTFGGKLDPATARGPLARWVSRGALAGDWRDWDRIRVWAAGMANELSPHG
jgi:menaquinone-dependent protoporphyrinogen oxidase